MSQDSIFLQFSDEIQEKLKSLNITTPTSVQKNVIPTILENKNVISAVRRLFDAGKLHSSWELQGYEYAYKDGMKTYTDYAFLGNVYLGENVAPAYGNMASVTAISSVDPSCETIISEALALDMAEKEEQDGEVKEKMENSENIVSEEITEETIEEEPVEAMEETSEQEEETSSEPEVVESEEAESSESDEVETSEETEEVTEEATEEAAEEAAEEATEEAAEEATEEATEEDETKRQ